MNVVLSRLKASWGWARILRLVFGVVLAINGFVESAPVIILFGSLLALQGTLNLGCEACAGAPCPTRSGDQMEDADVEFEFVHEESR